MLAHSAQRFTHLESTDRACHVTMLAVVQASRRGAKIERDTRGVCGVGLSVVDTTISPEAGHLPIPQLEGVEIARPWCGEMK
jgi:hypothetical protein